MAAVLDQFTLELPELLNRPDGLAEAEARLVSLIQHEAERFKGVHTAVSAIEVEALGLASDLGDPLLGRQADGVMTDPLVPIGMKLIWDAQTKLITLLTSLLDHE